MQLCADSFEISGIEADLEYNQSNEDKKDGEGVENSEDFRILAGNNTSFSQDAASPTEIQ